MSSALSPRAHVTVVTESGEQIEACRTYTVSQLNQQTAQVLDEVTASGRPAVVTKHGRFVALLTPLAAAGVESAALASGTLAAEFRNRRAAATHPAARPAMSADQVADEADTWS